MYIIAYRKLRYAMYNLLTILKPQDIVILLKIISSDGKYKESWNTVTLSRSLFISQSEISESLNRSVFIGFLERNKKTVYKKVLFDFLIYGIKYVFAVKPGPIVRGIPTAHSAPPLSNMIVSNGDNYVWEYEKGYLRGQAIEPLYKTVPRAISDNPLFYELLIFIDALRVGKAREREVAKVELEKRIIKGVLY